MSLGISNTKIKNESGFTIVELLIVIVVIAILAAITVVSYNGITARANSSSAKSSAQNVAKKIEAYNAEISNYPAQASDLTSAAQSTSYGGLQTSAFTQTLISSSNKPNPATTVNYFKCGTGATATPASTEAAVTTVTGAQVGYYNFQTNLLEYVNVGQTSGAVGSNNVVCGLDI